MSAPPRGAAAWVDADALRIWGSFGGVVALLAFVYRGVDDIQRVAASELEGAESFFFEPAGAAPGLVFAIAAWLLWSRWRRVVAYVGRGAEPHWGAALILPGAWLGVWGYRSDTPTLLVISLILVLLGGAWAIGGRGALRAISKPALFLIFAVPVPTLVINTFMFPLQVATAKAVAALLNTVGLDAFAFGDRILHGSHLFQVVESCSGVRGTLTLVMAAVLYLEIFPHRPKQALVILALTPLIGLVVNLIRVVTIVLNPLSHFGAVHTTQGMVMIAIGVFLIALCARIVGGERSGRRRYRRGPRTPRAATVGAVSTLVLVCAVALASLAYPDWSPKSARRPAIATLPYRLDGWKAVSLDLDQQFLGSVRFSKWIHRRYSNAQDDVELLIGEDDRNHYGHGIYGLKTAVPGSGWEVRPLPPARVGTREVDRFLAYAPGTSSRVVYRWYVGADAAPGALWRALSGVDRVADEAPDAMYVVRLSSEVSRRDGDRGVERAADRIDRFLATFDSSLGAVLSPQARPVRRSGAKANGSGSG